MTILLIIVSARSYLNTRRDDDCYNYMPTSMVLSLSPDEVEKATCRRFQLRNIKSVRLGKLALKYETGNAVDGGRIVPEDLALIAAPGMTFAYDTIFAVTELRYVRLMQRKEIQHHILKEHGFHIATGSISELSLHGLAYLEQLHFSGAKKLAQHYRENCFIIHLDGTNEGGMYNHFVVRDGISGNVLYAEKIVSESEKSIRAILAQVKILFGTPDAVISDMSPAIIKATKTELPGVPHRLCHFHFLKAIGQSILIKSHKPAMISVKRLREAFSEQRRKLEAELNLLQQSSSPESSQQREACQWVVALIDYINDYENNLNGEGFPFDLPAIAFHVRCEQAFKNIEKIMAELGKHSGSTGLASSTLCFIRNLIQQFMKCCHINQIRQLNHIFMELRNIIHPKSAIEKIPLNWGMASADVDAENISEQLKQLQKKAAGIAKNKKQTYVTQAWKIVSRRLIKYNDALNPIIEFRKGIFILPRTNNLSETGFRDCKRRARRTTGTKNLARYMDNLPPQYFYTFNLEDKEYIETVFGDKEIFDSFHNVDKNTVKKAVDKMKEQRQSPKNINRKLIRCDDFIEQFTNHFMLDKKNEPQKTAELKKQAPRHIGRKKVA